MNMVYIISKGIGIKKSNNQRNRARFYVVDILNDQFGIEYLVKIISDDCI